MSAPEGMVRSSPAFKGARREGPGSVIERVKSCLFSVPRVEPERVSTTPSSCRLVQAPLCHLKEHAWSSLRARRLWLAVALLLPASSSLLDPSANECLTDQSLSLFSHSLPLCHLSLPPPPFLLSLPPAPSPAPRGRRSHCPSPLVVRRGAAVGARDGPRVALAAR